MIKTTEVTRITANPVLCENAHLSKDEILYIGYRIGIFGAGDVDYLCLCGHEPPKPISFSSSNEKKNLTVLTYTERSHMRISIDLSSCSDSHRSVVSVSIPKKSDRWTRVCGSCFLYISAFSCEGLVPTTAPIGDHRSSLNLRHSHIIYM